MDSRRSTSRASSNVPSLRDQNRETKMWKGRYAGRARVMSIPRARKNKTQEKKFFFLASRYTACFDTGVLSRGWVSGRTNNACFPSRVTLYMRLTVTHAGCRDIPQPLQFGRKIGVSSVPRRGRMDKAGAALLRAYTTLLHEEHTNRASEHGRHTYQHGWLRTQE